MFKSIARLLAYLLSLFLASLPLGNNLFVPSIASAAAPTVGSISLTNGPPNLPNALLAAGLPSGSPVSDVYVDMAPMSASFSGTLTLGGANASNFSISMAQNCGSGGNIACGHLVTTGSLAAGTYQITVGTSLGGSLPVTVNVVDGVHAGVGVRLKYRMRSTAPVPEAPSFWPRIALTISPRISAH
jgi:hypothetical protein